MSCHAPLQRILLSAALIASLGSSVPLHGAASGTEFRLGHHGEPLVSVRANQAGPFVFILDTGSTNTVVADDVAVRLGLPVVAKATVRTSVGEALRPVARIDHLSMGEVTATGVFASVVARQALDPSGRIDGVIGQDVLADRRYTIDYEHRRMLWDEETARGAPEAWLPLRLEDGRFVVDIPAGGTTVTFVPDSGAEALVLYGGGERSALANGRGAPVVVETLTGKRLAERVFVPELRLGLATLRDVPAVVFGREDHATSACEGLLPLRYFRRVTLDGPGRRLKVEL